MNPIAKYNSRVEKVNSLVCVGLDPDFEKLPEKFKKAENPQFEFNKCIIDETAEFAAAFKPNSAFYEARGEQGWRELKMTTDYLREKYLDIFLICDAKRADIGSTNKGYATAIFDWLGFDAVTLNAYGGREAMKPFLDRADKACIIWCRSSNPGAGEFQDLLVTPPLMRLSENRHSRETCPRPRSGNGNPEPLSVSQILDSRLRGNDKKGYSRTVSNRSPYLPLEGGGKEGVSLWQVVAEKVATEWNYNHNCMLVAGATYPEELKKIREIVGDMTLLVPGIGAQGGEIEKTLKAGLNSLGKGMIINSSRGIIFAENPAEEAKKLRDEINKYR